MMQAGTVDDAEPAATLTIPVREVRFLRRAIAEATTAGQASEILFQFGQRLGASTAAAVAAAGHVGRAALVHGLQRLRDIGLGQASLEAFELRPELAHCHVVGHVVTPEEPPAGGAEEPAGELCDITVGFLAGLTAAITGMDVLCRPARGAKRFEPWGGAFEIRPAHREAAAGRGAPAPAGSARFFLRSMGKSLADADISLQELFENSADAIILIDLQNVIRFWSRGAERMFEYAREETVGRKIGFLLPPDLLETDELGQIQTLLACEGAVQNYVTRRMTKSGRELWVSLGRALLHDSNGNVVGSTATIRDITDQRQTEMELYRSRSLAMLGEMAAKVAHEIKNPLAGVYAAIQLLHRETAPMAPNRAVLDCVAAEIRRLDETVQDLLRFARPGQPRLRVGSLETCIREWFGALRLHPDVVRHRVEVSIEEGLLATYDDRLLGQALTNLVLNAGQAMEQPGVIRLVARRSGANLTIDVIDTGPGIAAAAMARIFEPFFTTKARGSGLGLAIARQNVEANRGRLEAHQDAGGGALFRILLPAPEESARGSVDG